MSRILYTYHDAVPELSGYYDADRLLALWARAWERCGWRTVRLDRATAARHPRWAEYAASVGRLPTRNARAYEDANYHRWMAMAMVGGGLMADPDVLPLVDWHPEPGGKLTVYSVDYLEGDGLCPCFVHGTAAQYEQACGYFVEAARRGVVAAHASDQDLLRVGGPPVDVRPDVLTYGDPRMAEARAIHYKTSAIRDEPGTKSERIARLHRDRL